MGSEVSRTQTTATTTLKQYFDELCAYAISIGMTYNQFWFEDIDLLAVYHRAEQMRMSRKNQEMWLQGLYIYNAVGNLAPVLNGFVKDHKAKPYINQPIPISEEERIERENQKVQRIKNYLMSKVKGEEK